MARPRTYKTQGIVLKHMPLRDADRLLTMYTVDMGKLRVVAKGVRRTKSRLGGHLEPLTHVLVSVARGKELDTITEAETIHSFRGLREDLQRVSKALYLAELVDCFTADGSPNAQDFQLLLNSLGRLQNAENDVRLLPYFETRLLANSGFAPELYRCVECRTTLEPGGHLFSCARGGVLCAECRVLSREALISVSLNGIKVLRLFQREGYDRVERLDVPQPLLNELGRLLRTYIRYVLERELKSTDFMDLVTSSTFTGLRRGRPR